MPKRVGYPWEGIQKRRLFNRRVLHATAPFYPWLLSRGRSMVGENIKFSSLASSLKCIKLSIKELCVESMVLVI